jgi:hypothetical protein
MLRGNSHWNNPGDIVEAAARSYHLDHWNNQENYVEVWVEKDALVGVVGQICEEIDVSYFSCRGYVSQSEMWVAAQRLKMHQDQLNQNVVLLHLGDHDPSGKDMSRDIVDRLATFRVSDVSFKRLALNMDQITQYNPPPNPTKLTDSRSTGYIKEFGNDCWELDALEPKVIAALIKKNSLKYRDAKKYNELIKKEAQEKALLDELSQNWSSVASNWGDIKSTFL